MVLAIYTKDFHCRLSTALAAVFQGLKFYDVSRHSSRLSLPQPKSKGGEYSNFREATTWTRLASRNISDILTGHPHHPACGSPAHTTTRVPRTHRVKPAGSLANGRVDFLRDRQDFHTPRKHLRTGGDNPLDQRPPHEAKKFSLCLYTIGAGLQSCLLGQRTQPGDTQELRYRLATLRAFRGVSKNPTAVPPS